jgi:hypothetical protein
MKVALVNAFPNLRYSAEKEFISRSISVLKKLGHDAIEVATSDEILAFDPSFVMVTHEFVAKTTPYYTVGLLWSPTQFYKNDPDRLKAIRSWDLVVPINSAIRQFANDIHFPRRHRSAVSPLNFYPSAPLTDLTACKSSDLSLAYVGVHWDGNRHDRLFRALAQVVDLHVYGPPDAWNFLPKNYRGPLPFDQNAVIQTLNRHGAALAIHKEAHIEEDTPSMRVFEACAAKCVVITDPLKPLLEIFGDSLEYIDIARKPEVVAREIAKIMHRHTVDADHRAQKLQRAGKAFASVVSLEKLFSELLDEVDQRIHSGQSLDQTDEQSDVTVILRCGSRPLSMLQRAVSSLRQQTHRPLGIIFARYAAIEGFESWLQDLQREERFIFLIDLEVPGNGVRSSAMWGGLREVKTEFFCMLDDDDELFPNHLGDLVELLKDNEAVSVAYSGVIRQEEDGKFLNDHDRFKGELGIEIHERRELFFFQDFNLDHLLRFENFIQSNTWLARRLVLTPEVLDDPMLEVQEDLYFYLLLASRYKFVFSGTASALWNWRSLSDDNTISAVTSDIWEATRERLTRRLSHIPFRGDSLGEDIVGIGRTSKLRADSNPLDQSDDCKRDWLHSAKMQSLGNRILEQARRVLPDQILTRFGIEDGSQREADYRIDFSAGRLPHFIVHSHGLSHAEPWGRWTVGSHLLLKFRQPLPRRFVLRIYGRAYESNHKKPVTIRLGEFSTAIAVSSNATIKRYDVEIQHEEISDTIILEISNPESPSKLSPGSRDHRKLGLAIARLEMFEILS